VESPARVYRAELQYHGVEPNADELEIALSDSGETSDKKRVARALADGGKRPFLSVLTHLAAFSA
jgi:hypothetical protein